MKKKIKKFWTTFYLIALSAFVFAQGPPPSKGKGREQIEAAKIGLISERLGLSPQEAQQFWPIYNEYSQKRRENHRQFQEARKSYDSESATEEQTKEMLRLGRQTKEKQLKLEQEYSERMLGVISNKQLLSLHEAEREFREMLLKRLEQRQQQQQTQEQRRRENNERMRNKRNN